MLVRLVWHFDNFAKIGAQQRPGRTPAVTLDQAAQGQDGLTASVGPGHTRAFQALRDQGFATGFHHTTGNGQVQANVFGIVHARLLIAEVGQFSLQAFAFIAAGQAALEAQGADDTFSAIIGFFEPGFQAFKVILAFLGAFAPGRIAAIFQVIAGVIEVHDFDRRLGAVQADGLRCRS